MSLLSLKGLNSEKVRNLFLMARFFKEKKASSPLQDKLVAHIFFEPSTRTRLSFETATFRLGAKSLLISGSVGTSLEKKETYLDTLMNVSVMGPDTMVVRCGDDVDLNQIASTVGIPVINAGWGTQGHPTQALLDIFTLVEKGVDITNLNLLFVGDIKHSRVFASHAELSAILGYKIGFCGPDNFKRLSFQGPCFNNLKDGLEWASVTYVLRYQKERFEGSTNLDSMNWKEFQINSDSLKNLKSGSYFMHPGPVNWGTEIAQELMADDRNLILDQVRHGVCLRTALLYESLGGKR